MSAYATVAEYDAAVRAEKWPHPYRILVAMRLTDDLDTLRSLLRGETVDPDRLDQRELFAAKHRRLVRLDTAAIDVLEAP